jgi:crossover junction endodeoxyribonuclease RuvC
VGGACAAFCPQASPPSGFRWCVIDIPVIGDEKRELNAAALRDWLRAIDPQHAFLELVTAMPSIPDATGKRRGMGAAGAFRFGGIFYALKAVLACCDVPYTLVTPQTWKKAHSLKGPDKEASRRRALQLFPDAAGVLARKKDQNRAEAMLLAEFGARPYQQAA